MTTPHPSALPEGPFCLTGPVEWPAKGTLPLRRDLAHVALANRFLVANYAEPKLMQIGDAPAQLIRSTKGDEDVVATLEPGTQFEALDVMSSWVWGCIGPDGPSGYVPRSAFAQ